jgi:hypothetical protein
MRSERGKTALRCAIYTRVSTEHGLEQEFNWPCHANVSAHPVVG